VGRVAHIPLGYVRWGGIFAGVDTKSQGVILRHKIGASGAGIGLIGGGVTTSYPQSGLLIILAGIALVAWDFWG